MNNSPIITLSEGEHKSLSTQWDFAAENFMNRAGNDQQFSDGGHNIKDNPLLKAAILEIRDGYFQAFSEIRHWQKKYKIDPQAEFNDRLADLDYDIILHNKESAERLQKPLYGFTQEQADKITAENPPKYPEHIRYQLNDNDIHSIIGNIIKKSITVFSKPPLPEISVRNAPLNTHPDDANMKRSSYQRRIQQQKEEKNHLSP